MYNSPFLNFIIILGINKENILITINTDKQMDIQNFVGQLYSKLFFINYMEHITNRIIYLILCYIKILFFFGHNVLHSQSPGLRCLSFIIYMWLPFEVWPSSCFYPFRFQFQHNAWPPIHRHSHELSIFEIFCYGECYFFFFLLSLISTAIILFFFFFLIISTILLQICFFVFIFSYQQHITSMQCSHRYFPILIPSFTSNSIYQLCVIIEFNYFNEPSLLYTYIVFYQNLFLFYFYRILLSIFELYAFLSLGKSLYHFCFPFLLTSVYIYDSTLVLFYLCIYSIKVERRYITA